MEVLNIKSEALYTLLFKLDSILLLLNDMSPSIPTLKDRIVFISIGVVHSVPQDNINVQFLALQPTFNVLACSYWLCQGTFSVQHCAPQIIFFWQFDLTLQYRHWRSSTRSGVGSYLTVTPHSESLWQQS
jgi:hypothetical protein